MMLSNAANSASASSNEETQDHSWNWHGSFGIWAIVAAGAILRLIALGHKSFWIDEIASVAIARRAAPVFWHFLWHDEGNMALYYVLLRPWLHLGYGESVVRTLSVIPGVLSIPVMYFLGTRLGGRETGLLSALLLALNACAIGVSQEARAYSFVVLAILLATYLFVQLIEKPSYELACAYGLLAGLTCYFHYFGILVPAAHAVSLVVAPRDRVRWRPLMLAAAMIVVIAAPILWLIHAQNIGHISWVQPLSLLEFYHLGVFLAADGGKAIGAVLLALDLVLVGLFVAKFKTVLRHYPNQVERWHYTLIASSFISPIVITLLVSIVQPAFYHRFLIICLPGWLLMSAVGLQETRRRAWRVSALVAVCTLSLVSTGIMYARVTEDWRGAVSYLIANTHANDRVVYYQSIGEFAGESYRDWSPGGNESRPPAVGVNPLSMEWMSEIDRAPRVWLVLYRASRNSPETDLVERELEKPYEREGQRDFRGVTIVEYARRK